MNNDLNLMQARLGYYGGKAQQDRMIKDKRRTLDKVVLYSYQGATVRKLDSGVTARALINPNKLVQNYDDKIISIGYEYEYKPGTVFEWLNTNTKWLIYLQDLTEPAYFKGDIRKCNYQISWKNDDEVKTIYVAVRGPTETKINSIQKSNISLDIPNYSLNILLPKTKDTLEQFKRYSKFYLQPLAEGDSPICWKIEATDTISMPGIIEINAIEYYSNEFEDNIKDGVVDGLIIDKIPEEEIDSKIEGEIFIKPKESYSYKYTGTENGNWNYDKRLPITANINGKEITIIWNAIYTGQFILSYANEEKTIAVESLF